jgi:hypothetical protein
MLYNCSIQLADLNCNARSGGDRSRRIKAAHAHRADLVAVHGKLRARDRGTVFADPLAGTEIRTAASVKKKIMSLG